jgi:hypothetical protein
MRKRQSADYASMARAFGLPLLLAALAVGGYLFLRQVQTDGPTSPTGTQMVTQADSTVAGANFASATPALQAWFTEHGTYVGATLPPGTGVALVRADGTGYCLQAGVGGTQEHELGPQGAPQPGPC